MHSILFYAPSGLPQGVAAPGWRLLLPSSAGTPQVASAWRHVEQYANNSIKAYHA